MHERVPINNDIQFLLDVYGPRFYLFSKLVFYFSQLLKVGSQ